MNARTHYEALAKQAAGEKVDALAHLQILANDMRAAGKPMSADRLDVVRVAVAELIAAMQDQHAAIDWLMARLVSIEPDFTPTMSHVWPAFVRGSKAFARTGAYA